MREGERRAEEGGRRGRWRACRRVNFVFEPRMRDFEL